MNVHIHLSDINPSWEPPGAFTAVEPIKLAPARLGAIGTSLRERMIIRRVRDKVRTALCESGLSLVRQDVQGFASLDESYFKPLTGGEADSLLGYVSDHDVLEAVESVTGFSLVAGLGDGTILEWFKSLFEWFSANSDKILAVVKIILALIATFI